MTDRELLEAAARAAGIELADFQSGLPGQPLWMARGQENPETGSRDWNPLSSDGDALRLAVKLGLTIGNEHESAGVAYCTRSEDEDFPVVESGAMGDPPGITEGDYAATRRAIVLAAASIGKTGEPA